MKSRLSWGGGLGLFASLATLTGADAVAGDDWPPPPSETSDPCAPLSVLDEGAAGDGATDDTDAINTAVRHACGTVYFPAASYRVTSAIRVDRDGITLAGADGAEILLDAGPGASLDDFPEAILVNRVSGGALARTDGVVIENLSILVNRANEDPAESAGILQLNFCRSCTVSRVWIGAAPGAVLGPQVDGIVMSQGSSGVITESAVDGMPKTGIYIAANFAGAPFATGPVLIDSSTAAGAGGLVGAAGFLITGSSVQLRSCTATDNRGPGLVIGVLGLTPPVGASDVVVDGGDFSQNGESGVYLASAYEAVVPTGVAIHGVTADHNGEHGIWLERGGAIEVSDSDASGNALAGIAVGAGGLPTPAFGVVSEVSIRDVWVHGNSTAFGAFAPGIALFASDSVRIERALVTDDAPAPTQLFGLRTYAMGILTAPGSALASSRLTLVDVTADGAFDLLVNAFVFAPPYGVPATSGEFRLSHPGSPAGVLAAPASSTYVDTTTGIRWRKASGANEDGWVAE